MLVAVKGPWARSPLTWKSFNTATRPRPRAPLMHSPGRVARVEGEVQTRTGALPTARRRSPLRHRMGPARNEQPAFRPSVTSVPIGVFGSGLIFVSLCPRGPGRTEEPFLEGDPAHNARAVLGLDAATAAALPAPTHAAGFPHR
jgi:hypothetical protein